MILITAVYSECQVKKKNPNYIYAILKCNLKKQCSKCKYNKIGVYGVRLCKKVVEIGI